MGLNHTIFSNSSLKVHTLQAPTATGSLSIMQMQHPTNQCYFVQLESKFRLDIQSHKITAFAQMIHI